MTSNTKFTGLMLATLLVLSTVFGAVGTVAASSSAGNYEYDAHLTDGGTYWAGQTVLVDDSNTGATADKTLELHKNTSDGDVFVKQVAVDGNAEAPLSTDNLEGTYTLYDSGDNVLATFDVYQHTLNVTGEDSEALDAGESANITVNFDSNRATADYNVSADGLEEPVLREVLNDTFTTETDVAEDGTVVLANANSGEHRLNFTGVPEGEYTLNFESQDSTAAGSYDVTVGQASDATASADRNVYQQERGDVLVFNIQTEGTSEAYLQVGDDDVNYNANVTVTDGNDDGVVTVAFNTHTAGDGISMTDSYTTFGDSEDNGDTVTVDSETDIAVDRLEAGQYDLSVNVNGYDGRETDVGAIQLNEGGVNSVSTHVVPKNAKLTDLEDLAANVAPSDTVAQEDRLVVKVDVSGTSGYINSEAGTTASMVTESTHDSGVVQGAFLVVEETNPTANTDAETFTVSDADLYTDARNDAQYFVFDASDLSSDAELDSEYTATFTMNESSDYIENEDDTQEASANFEYVERTLTFDNIVEGDDSDYVNVELNESGVGTVSGDTTVAPGTEITINARSTGSSPFLMSETVVVGADGTFSTQFDFGDVAQDQQFNLEALNTQVEGQVTPYSPPTYQIAFDAMDEDGNAVTAQYEVVNVDGEVVASGEDASATVTDLANGNYTVNANADGYNASSVDVVVDDADATASVTLTAQETESTPTPTPTQTPTETTTEEQTNETATEDTDESSSATETSTPGQPGFGVVVALIGVIAAALFAARRQN